MPTQFDPIVRELAIKAKPGYGAPLTVVPLKALTDTFVTDSLLALQRLGYDIPAISSDPLQATAAIKKHINGATRVLSIEKRAELEQYMKEAGALSWKVYHGKKPPVNTFPIVNSIQLQTAAPLTYAIRELVPYAAALEYRARNIAELCGIPHTNEGLRDTRFLDAAATLSKAQYALLTAQK